MCCLRVEAAARAGIGRERLMRVEDVLGLVGALPLSRAVHRVCAAGSSGTYSTGYTAYSTAYPYCSGYRHRAPEGASAPLLGGTTPHVARSDNSYVCPFPLKIRFPLAVVSVRVRRIGRAQ